MRAQWRTVANGGACGVDEVPCLAFTAFREALLEEASHGGRLVGLFPLLLPGEPKRLLALVALEGENRLGWLSGELESPDGFPSLTPDWPQAHALERALWESHGLRPEGHPWLKPLRRPAAAGAAPGGGEGDRFFAVEGDEIHEVAVGPVHAGIIEPGHFRFQCRGEVVLHLEIRLGYQHRGAAALLARSKAPRRLAVAESLAGDSVLAHGTAYCMVEEALAASEAPLRAQAVRALALELERIANHAGDLGALAGDVGFLPAASFFGRLRGEFLNLTQELCGSRTGRGLLQPGGVRFDADAALRDALLAKLPRLRRDLEETARLLFESPSVQDRFEGTGPLRRETAEALGVVGPAARASGISRDVRQDHPAGYYRFAQIPVQGLPGGDVHARAMVRWLEVQQSLRFLEEQLPALPGGEVRNEPGPRRARRLAAALVEGWRGEAVHAAVTDEGGEVVEYQVVDPSVRNWMGLALAMRGQAISDFPLCNKSFNLAYAGHDL